MIQDDHSERNTADAVSKPPGRKPESCNRKYSRAHPPPRLFHCPAPLANSQSSPPSCNIPRTSWRGLSKLRLAGAFHAALGGRVRTVVKRRQPWRARQARSACPESPTSIIRTQAIACFVCKGLTLNKYAASATFTLVTTKTLSATH